MKSITAAATIAAGLLLTSCSHSITGVPVAVSTPEVKATVPIQPFPAPDYSAEGQQNWYLDPYQLAKLDIDELVKTVVSSVVSFWSQEHAVNMKVTVRPADKPLTCSHGGFSPSSSALWCNTGGITSEVLYVPAVLTKIREAGGELPIILTMAHEVGHAVENAQRWNHGHSKDAVELGADCFAGFYTSALGYTAEQVGASYAFTEMARIKNSQYALAEGYVAQAPLQVCTRY